ncbi:MAG: guanylate kinase [Actinobacteria bacterium]|nr:guanylate kinase [Actinomycetota bacterium]
MGVLLVLAGPSGVGKGTIGKRLLERDPGLQWSVSATTRAPRPGEVEGVDYRFVSREDFERLRANGGFLESFEVYGQLKGTLRAPVEARLRAGGDVLMEVDVQGALAVKDAIPDALLVFVRAPTPEAQRARLVARASDDDEQLVRRLETAGAEEAASGRFDAVVVNDDLDRAVEEVAAILKSRRVTGAP